MSGMVEETPNWPSNMPSSSTKQQDSAPHSAITRTAVVEQQLAAGVPMSWVFFSDYEKNGIYVFTERGSALEIYAN